MKVLTGKVISIGKTAQTAVIEVETKWRHPLYKKILKKNKKFLVHLENSSIDKQKLGVDKQKLGVDKPGLDIKEGDIVKIGETRPVSKNKHFKILEDVRTKP